MASNKAISIPKSIFANKFSRANLKSKFSNKRITRLESDIDLGGRLMNRNPRNLEQLSFENKPSGFWLDRVPPNSWNTLVLERKGKYLSAVLKQWSGRRLVEASTKEPQLQKYFVNPNTAQAATILAKVIARRCLQSGYLCAGCNEDLTDVEVGLKTKQFFGVVKESGLVLQEPAEIVPRDVTDV